MKVIINEKANQSKIFKKYFQNNQELLFTHASGHLLELVTPNILEWKNINLNNLPAVFNRGDITNNLDKLYQPKEENKYLLKNIFDFVNRDDIDEIICACDWDAEGEAIFRTIMEYCINKNPKIKLIKLSRMYFKDETCDVILTSFEKRKEIDLNTFGLKGILRGITDFTFGLNVTGALTVKNNTLISFGRVQTPVLRMVVERTLQNKTHKKVISYTSEIVIDDKIFKCNDLKFDTKQQANDFNEKNSNTNVMISKAYKNVKQNPPSLYMLSTIQQWASKNHKMSPTKTLDICQSLYDKHKLISYPRTDYKEITLNEKPIVEKLFGNKIFNDIRLNQQVNNKIIGKGDNHTGLRPLVFDTTSISKLTDDEKIIFNEIYLSMILNFIDPLKYIDKITTFEIKYENDIYTFKNVESKLIDEGYTKIKKSKKIYTDFDIQDDKSISYTLTNAKIEIRTIETKPKPLYTFATLIGDMIAIHKYIDDPVLKDKYKNSKGIGTASTRDKIFESLLKSELLIIENDKIISTQKGKDIIILLNRLKNPLLKLTYSAQLEQILDDVHTNEDIADVLNEVNSKTVEMINSIINTDTSDILSKYAKNNRVSYGKCPLCKSDIIKIKSKKNQKSYYICTNNEKHNDTLLMLGADIFTENDLKKLLIGGSTTTKTLKNKDGVSYKAKFILNQVTLQTQMNFAKTKNKK